MVLEYRPPELLLVQKDLLQAILAVCLQLNLERLLALFVGAVVLVHTARYNSNDEFIVLLLDRGA